MNGSLAIPDGLRRQFEELERRLWRFDSIVAACGSACSLLLSYALIFVSDRLWDTPPWMRVIFTGAGIAACVCFFFGYGKRWIWGSRSFPVLATLVQRRYRRLGDRLLGIVELADAHKRPANFSAALCDAAINQVATEASKIDFREAVGTKRPRHYMLGAAGACLLAVVFCIVAPQAGWNALVRWFRPTLNVARYTFVSMDDLPDHLVVPHGEPFDIAVKLSEHSFLHPSSATARFEKQPEISAPVRSGVALFHIPGQTQAGVLALGAGDVKRKVRIEPEFRPELKQLTAHIDFPAYLLYPPLDRKIDGGSLTTLAGSSVKISGQTSRALGSAYQVGKDRITLQVHGDTFSTASSVPTGATLFTFTWRDNLGLDAAAPAKVRLQLKEDVAPQVECRGLPAAVAILEDEVVHINIMAADDYGILNAGLRWQTSSKKTGSQPGAVVEKKVAEGQPQDKTVECKFDFSPKLLGIPADTGVSLCATATDRFPNRAASLSATHEIYVLSREAHAQLIQAQFEKIMGQLEELTRKQESLMDAGKNVREQSPDKLSNKDSEKKIGDQSAAQRETAEQLEKLAQKTADTVREASKNSDLSPSTLKDWAKQAQKMSELAQQSMPNASKSLSDAKNDPNKRSENLDKAIKQQSEILKQMREMQKASEKSLEKLMTQNLAARLRKVAGHEKNIASSFEKILPDTIGLKTEHLPASAKQTVDHLGDLHDAAREETTRLHGEISRMFERTNLDRYSDVVHEMETANTDEALQKLGGTIRDNMTIQAMHSTTAWSKQFEAWADRLSDKDDSKSADSGENSGEGNSPDMKALMALLQLREREDTLRDQTGALEKMKDSNAGYKDQAKLANGQQQDIKRALEQLVSQPDFPIPAQNLAPAGKAMNDAADLLARPETGKSTISTETDVINLLDAAILAQSQKSGKGMAGLMGMMGLGKPGNSPGGNPSGGDTDRDNTHVAGSNSGKSDDSRHITQASGNAGAPLPAEFREAIESYQRAVEEGHTP